MRKKIVFIFLIFIFSSFGQEFSHIKNFGIEYNFYELDTPRPIKIHVLKVDLSKNFVEIKVIPSGDPDGNGPAEAELTNPLKLIKKEKEVIAFINTNPWDSFPDSKGNINRKWYEGQYVDIKGLVVSDGKFYSEPETTYISVFINKEGKLEIKKSLNKDEVMEGVAGFNQIVKDGQIIIEQSEKLNPLTGIGVDKSGYIVYFVVVDGRQKGYSEGMSLFELADFMLKLGCWNVAQMDGGGSSIMGLIDNKRKIRIVNKPSDGRIRPLPVIMIVKRKGSKR
ncbi:MAG: phosphodiester glycosidase family protein [bacterium]|nr:phosphodiester glycosidase family protein [bacterium]MCX7917049.1 phosphodiester glycosidase family protein [bacterium]MDW8164388.1 phosphodiester glycosidase family protein [Candidatus Omnitrophota bacterium]